MLQRVRKVATKTAILMVAGRPAPSAYMENHQLSQQDDSALRDCLDLWVRYMSRDDAGIGWRGRSVMLDSDASADSQQLYDRADNKSAEAINGCIDSLPRSLSWAIGKGCGMNGVWRYPNLDYLSTLIRAKFELVQRLKINHETRSYFT